ncbi:cuticle protein 8 [Ceratitis capitata]|uniref:(Mediterranean fruit fly) hypothetical protein n=1 Tax=Ceratitis capitata TaxID=7213 RepID=W8BP03_CERCA|nr:cuticle protein 8 [Ceratitis capitata]CAD6997098.1 unnamed protein product [Ceratitis capitata]
MFYKLLILTVFTVVHVHAIGELRDLHEEHGPVAYEFQYEVHDPHTGDIKSQKEARKDDHVVGVYQLIEPDGHRRIVHYKADDHNGFEAVVSREPTNIKIPVPEVQHKILAPTLLHH